MTVDFADAPPLTWTCICRPDDPHKSLVGQDGALLYGFRLLHRTAWWFDRVVEPSLQTGAAPLRRTQTTEDARTPVVVTTLEYPTATLELRTFAHLAAGGCRCDVVLWTVTASDAAEEILTGLHLDVYDRDAVFRGATGAPSRRVYAYPPAEAPEVAVWYDDHEPENPDAEPPPLPPALVSAPQPLVLAHATGFRPGATGLRTTPAILGAGEQLRGAIVLPLDGELPAEVDLAWAETALAEERAFWAGLALQPLALEVPDPAIQDLLTSCARNLLQAREVHDGLPVFQVGPTIFRGFWVVDAYFMLEAARYLGLDADADAGFEAMLRRVTPSGAITEMEDVPHLKETPVGIATIVRQCELTGDDERLRLLWPAIGRAVAYVESLPDETGLFPPGFGDGGIGGARRELTTPLWMLVGLKAAREAAARVAPDERDRVDASFRDLLARFREHAAAWTRTLPDGTRYLPMVPPGSGEHNLFPDAPVVPRMHELRPGTGTWSLAQAIWPGEVFAPDDPLVVDFLRLLETLDDDEGIPAETGWTAYAGLWTYYASFAAHVWLYAGRPDKAAAYLYAFANHAAPTRVWREEQSLRSTGNGLFSGDMPHNWASAEFVRLVRDLLVFERGETLDLLAGLPPAWAAGPVRVERTPTRFGRVGVALADAEIAVELDGSRLPERCRVFCPPGRWTVRVAGAEPQEVDGPAVVELARSSLG
ncbi:MAG TPA: hypothetical protein VFJ77_08185 [Gaiellaceae bacterium]|nr:hypothetical protein [Gaiellaceae bacterium]